MRLAQIDTTTNLVVNTLLGDLQEMQGLLPEFLILESDIAGIGWMWTGTELVPPVQEEAPPVEPPPTTIITKLAFRNRFTQAEKVALYTAAETNIPIRVYLDDVNAATFIDLARLDTIIGVQQLEAAGLLAQGRANEILTNPVQEIEKYTGRG